MITGFFLFFLNNCQSDENLAVRLDVPECPTGGGWLANSVLGGLWLRNDNDDKDFNDNNAAIITSRGTNDASFSRFLQIRR